MPSDQTFADLLAANEIYAQDFRLAGLPALAARGLAVLTCIDSRIEPLAMLGLGPGDAKILRNAGARVTGDVLPSSTDRRAIGQTVVASGASCGTGVRSCAEAFAGSGPDFDREWS